MSGSCPIPPTRSVPTLADIVDLLDEAIAPAPSDHSVVVRVRRPGDDVELGFRPLDPGTHPIDVLLGFRAPADWHAIGVISPGRAHDLAGARPATPVRLIHLVDRSGASRSALRSPGGADLPPPEGATGGFLDDCCRRALGLPTPPPPSGPTVWWSAIWLERVLEAALRDPARGWCWRDLARLHPLVSGGAAPPGPEALAARVRRVVPPGGWSALRATASAGPEDAAAAAIWRWMDDGLFARWALARVPDPRDILDPLGALLPPDLLDALAAAVAALDR